MLYIYPKGSINKFETLDLFSSNYCALALFEYNKGGFALERLTLLVSLCEVCFCLFGG
jgi:hypothetical protein